MEPIGLDRQEGKRRVPAKELEKGFRRRLAAYVAAAGTIGVGLSGAAQTAKADIIYTSADTTLVCPPCGGLYLDLNHDGTNDFSLAFRGLDGVGLFVSGLGQSNGALTTGYFAAALTAGAPIGPTGQFKHSASMVYLYASTWGPWADVSNRYLGLRFKVDGQTHFGWARLNVTAGPYEEITATLTGYAYDTVSGQSIEAGQTDTPEPGTLGLLALGSLGLGFWRRKKQN